MKKILITLIALLSVSALSSCSETSSPSTDTAPIGDTGASNTGSGETETPATEAAFIDSFAYSEINDNEYSGWVADAYQVNFYEGNIYQLIHTSVNCGFGSLILGATAVINYGTYIENSSEDGYTSYDLNRASEVIINSYSSAGGYSIAINTTSADQDYPVELPAQSEGEKNMAQNKEDVLNSDYGLGYKIYTQDAVNTFTFTDPTGSSSETGKQSVTTASGDVSSVLTTEIKEVKIVDDTDIPGSMGDGSWDAKILIAMTYEDNTYDYISTTVQYGYTMILGTTITMTTGDYTEGTSEDGYTPITLSDADDVLLNSYSLAGGFNIQIDTASKDQEYPVELPAQSEGEKNMANDKAAVISAYGKGKTVYFKDKSAGMSLTDPALSL